jgi:hypothetical protein
VNRGGRLNPPVSHSDETWDTIMAKRSVTPDKPVPFGYKCAWYAMRTNDLDATVTAFGLRNSALSTWRSGIDAAYCGRVFVTPPLGDWILAAGWDLFYEGDDPAKSVLPILTRLSDTFGEAQYFATHRVPEAHCWALARVGKLIRAFGYVGERGEITWKAGKPTKAELALDKGALEFPGPDESHVMEVAGAWSVNPCELESNFTEPGLGRVGDFDPPAPKHAKTGAK